jgi:F0F1-type ATP synthase membrane subunit c/vacuolar-type H+-ATPase subunit K
MRETSMQPDQLTPLKQRYLVTNFIGLAMIGSVFIYAVIVEIFKRYYAPFSGFASLPPHIADMLKYLLFLVALVFFLLIRVIQARLTAKSPQLLPSIAIATFALCEAVGIFGLMLFLLTGNSLDFYMFFAISLFLFYLFFPKYDHWEKLMAERPADAPEQQSS